LVADAKEEIRADESCGFGARAAFDRADSAVNLEPFRREGRHVTGEEGEVAVGEPL